MSQFNYKALDERGQEQSGFIEASDKSLVLQQLKQRGLYVLNLESAATTEDSSPDENDAWSEINSMLSVSNSKKVFFFKQLALMIRSGLSITESLDVMTKMQRGPLRQIIKEINYHIKRGDSFSSAIADHKKVFSSLTVQMIHSAEVSGELDITLMRIADYIERKAALKKQVLSAMMYPAFTLCAALLVFIFMLVYIIPKFQEFLQQSGKAIPPATQVMVDLGEFFNANWQVLIAFMVIGIIGLILTYRNSKGRLFLDQCILITPLVSNIIVTASMAQLSWGLAMLLKSGVPVVESLRIISNMINNNVISKSIHNASENVLHGQELSLSFNQPYIAELVHQLMVVGERSGNLVQIMEEANNYYEDELKTKTKRLANAVEPASIVLIGSIVGFVYYGFFQALMAVSTG
jgi:type II secretory pathway component PulF